MSQVTTRAGCERLDHDDPLRAVRDEFDLPTDLVYLDGNSLGALPRRARRRLREVVDEEWGRGLVRSWTAAHWIEAPARVGDKIARLIGAEPGEVVAADSTSVNIFKLLAAALAARPERRVILARHHDFPTDGYVAQGLVRLLGAGHELRRVEAEHLPDALRDDVAVLLLTHVDYRTGEIFDMGALTAAAHRAGVLTLWDLCHSAGAVPVDLGSNSADLAVGCGYKYLNGGPGAPAFLYVARRLQAELRQPISGWMGHADPFAFDPRYEPAEGIAQHLSGTPAMLALTALEAAIDVWLDVDMAAVRRKSLALTELFIERVDTFAAAHGLALASPREGLRRGSQVALRHPEAYRVVQALIARGVVCDMRQPDIVRFGFTPLYTRHVDAWDGAEALRAVLESGEWQAVPEGVRAAVT